MLSVLDKVILMTTHNIFFFSRQNKKISLKYLNVCFLELSEKFPRASKTGFESSTVDASSVFKILKNCSSMDRTGVAEVSKIITFAF